MKCYFTIRWRINLINREFLQQKQKTRGSRDMKACSGSAVKYRARAFTRLSPLWCYPNTQLCLSQKSHNNIGCFTLKHFARLEVNVLVGDCISTVMKTSLVSVVSAQVGCNINIKVGDTQCTSKGWTVSVHNDFYCIAYSRGNGTVSKQVSASEPRILAANEYITSNC
jgi:hypothetical protein